MNISFPEWDTTLFYFLNGLHVSWLDSFMVLVSSVPVWIPLYLAVIFFLIKKYKWQGVFFLFCIVLCITVADQFSTVIKYAVQRPRPCQVLADVHLLENCGSGYGFVSNHSANVFGFALITSLLFRLKWYTIGIFFWALLVAYSRIYLGKHYPLDILGGAAFGMSVAFLCYLLTKVYTPLVEKIRVAGNRGQNG